MKIAQERRTITTCDSSKAMLFPIWNLPFKSGKLEMRHSKTNVEPSVYEIPIQDLGSRGSTLFELWECLINNLHPLPLEGWASESIQTSQWLTLPLCDHKKGIPLPHRSSRGRVEDESLQMSKNKKSRRRSIYLTPIKMGSSIITSSKLVACGFI